MLPPSGGGLLIATSPEETLYDISPMSDYAVSMPDGPLPAGQPNRRSTGASEALQYYWSASAGGRSGSVSSSLGMSPIESSPHNGLASPYSVSSQPPLHETKSAVSLRELVQQEADFELERSRSSRQLGSWDELTTVSDHHNLGRLPDVGMLRERERERDVGSSSNMGQTNRHIHLVSYPSDGSVSGMASGSSIDVTPPSPSRSSLSGDSEYSLLEDDVTGATAVPRHNVAEVRSSRPQPHLQTHRRALVGATGDMGVLLDPSFEEWVHQRAWAENPSPTSPLVTSPTDMWSTPTQGAYPQDPHRAPTSPADGWARSSPSPGKRTNSSDRTPRNSTQSPRTPREKTTFKAGGRLLFVAPPDVSRRSLDALEREYTDMRLDGVHGSRSGLAALAAGAHGSHEDKDGHAPHSAPAIKTAFGDIELPPGSRERRTRHTSLLPPPTTPLELTSTSTTPSMPPQLAIPSPRQSPRSTPRLSPEPPPKSELRKAARNPSPSPTSPHPYSSSTTPAIADGAIVTTPESVSRKTSQSKLPTIINTPHTPEAPSRKVQTVPVPGSAQSSRTAPTPRSRSTSPRVGAGAGVGGVLPNSGTIQDLTDILGGAIDEIGLIDSRDTPPPMVAEPSKQQQTAPATPAQQQAQQSPAAASKQQPSSSMLDTVPPRSTSQGTQSAAGLPPFTASSAGSVSGSLGGGSGDLGQLSPSSIAFSTSPALSHSSTSASHPLPPTPSGGIGLGLMGAVGAASAVAGAGNNLVHASTNPATTSRQQVTRHVRKASSILSIRSGSMSLNSGAPSTFSQAGPLPAAVTFGNIKTLKTSSERARSYARSMQDLMAADSGLREWWTTAHTTTRVNARPKQAGMQSLGLGLREPSGPPSTLGLATPSMRIVSGGSEFPMRGDSYTATQIMVRNMEPSDEPTALPPNLPYPQLQLGQLGNGGAIAMSGVGSSVKSSNSVQSIASVASKARTAGGGLLSAFGRLKKDKEPGLAGLGPPNGGSPVTLSSSANSSKRNLLPPVPGSASGSSRDSLDLSSGVESNGGVGGGGLGGHGGPRVQPTLAVPRGPRAVPGGSPTDTVLQRSSFDLPPRPLSHAPARASLDAGSRPNFYHRGSNGGSASSREGLGLGSGLGMPWNSPQSSVVTSSSPLARGERGGSADRDMGHGGHGHGHGGFGGHGHAHVMSMPAPSSQQSTPQQPSQPTPTQPKREPKPAGHFTPTEDEIRQMSEALPRSERPLVKAYLQRYGALTYAMTAYIEDEKQGTLMTLS